MLHNTLLNIPQIVLLRSDKVMYHLFMELLNNKKITLNNYDIFYESTRDFYPNRYRLDEIEMSLSQDIIKKSGISRGEKKSFYNGLEYNFSFMENIFNNFFEFDGNKILAKEDKLEIYLSFITKVSPLFVMGYKIANDLYQKNIDTQTLFSLISAYTPLGFKVDEKRDYAENHIHLKGAGYASFTLSKLISHKTPKKYFQKEFIKEIPRIDVFTFINNHHYSIGQLIEILKLSINTIYQSILEDSKSRKKNKREANAILKLQNIIHLNKAFESNSYRYSLNNIHQVTKLLKIFKDNKEFHIIEEIIKLHRSESYARVNLLQNILFFYIFEKTDSHVIKIFIKIYIHIFNILRSFIIMSQNRGLAHFSEFSASSLKEIDFKNANHTAKSIISSGTDYVNAKMGVRDTPSKISDSISDYIFAFSRNSTKIQYNFGLSTVKSKEKSYKIITGNLQIQFYRKRKKILKETYALREFLQSMRYKRINMFRFNLKYYQIKAFQKRKKYINKTFNISDYVISIDAVGKETHTPPEVFAPFFNYLRSPIKKVTHNIFMNTKIFDIHPKLLLTIHAGEDFNHLITGIRRIDESITFFNMGQNDRIGHAISLGISPQLWLESSKSILMNKGEYLDDLIWLSVKLKSLKKTDLNISLSIQRYESEIWPLFREIYQIYDTHITLSDLYEAWLYRKNCALTYFTKKGNKLVNREYANIVLEEIENKNAKYIYELYQRDPKVRDAYKEVIQIDKLSLTKDVLDIYEALQDFMINELAHKGIIIEVNPSSNIFISSMDSYMEHPIFRFSPPKDSYLEKGGIFNKFNQRHGKIAVLINSDDPGIFVTSLQNEYRVIKNVAKVHYHCSDKEASDWLDDIRCFSIDTFKDSYYTANPL